jgi:hypothetical protein
MNTLTLRLLVAIVPLLLLMGTFTLSELVKKYHGKRTAKRVTTGALKGLSQGAQLPG